MAIRVLRTNRAALSHLTSPTPKEIPLLRSPKSLFLSTKSSCQAPVPPNFPHQSQYRKQISLANLLQRYGFPPSQLHNFLKRNHFLLNSNLHEIEKSLGILFSFKIPQNSIVSLISDCSGVLEFEFLKEWETGFSKFGDLRLSSLVIKSVLEHSRKLQIGPDGLSRSLEVLKRLGFSESTVSGVLEGFPRVMMMKESEIHCKIEFMERIGIPREGIDRVVGLFPQVLGFRIEGRLVPLLNEFGDLGFSEELVRKEIVREPRILSMELGELSRCLELLRTLKCRVPIKEQIFSEGAFRAGFEVKLRVDCLCKHGLIRRDALKVLWKEPRVIVYDIEDIEKKIEFLVSRMRFSVGCLAEVPEYLGVNFEKKIIPRYNVIEHLKSKGGLGCEVGLREMIKPSRLRFYNLYVKPYPECEKMFGRFSDGQVKSKHPVGLWRLFKPQRYRDSEQDMKTMKVFMDSLV